MKEKQTHTPEKWAAIPSEVYRTELEAPQLTMFKQDLTIVCDFPPSDHAASDAHEIETAVNSHADLLRQREELVAVLKAIEPLLAIAFNPNPDDDDLFTVGRGRVQQLCNLARTALAKAQGEEV